MSPEVILTDTPFSFKHIYCVKFPYCIHTIDRLCHDVSIMKSGMHGEVALFIPNTDFLKLLQINTENDVFSVEVQVKLGEIM